tara:strand:- start:134 stop:379 length:246 start_codon:yes stop_codon:yes gene_type:complete
MGNLFSRNKKKDIFLLDNVSNQFDNFDNFENFNNLNNSYIVLLKEHELLKNKIINVLIENNELKGKIDILTKKLERTSKSE